MAENKYAQFIRKQLRNCNAECIPIVANKYAPAGWPDTYVSHPYWHGWIEFKDVSTKIQKHQVRQLEKLRKNGEQAWVVRAPDKIQDPDGNTVATFEPRSSVDLLRVLQRLQNERSGTS